MITISEVYGLKQEIVGYEIEIDKKFFHIQPDQEAMPGIRTGAFPRSFAENHIADFSKKAISRLTADPLLNELLEDLL